MFRYAILLLLTLPFWLAAQQSTNTVVNARAELGAKEIEIGDQVYLSVKISAPPGTEVDGLEPAYINTITGVELVEGGVLNLVSEKPERLYEQRLLITSFDTGYIAITPLPYTFRSAAGQLDTAYTNDLLLRVRAYPVTDDSELRPIKGIIEEPRNLLDFWPLFLVLFLGLAAYAFYQYRQRQTRVAPPPPPPPPADLQALNRLKELEAKQLWQTGETKIYYTELTDVLRTYLQDQFSINAREMTSRQIIAALGSRLAGATGEMKTELSQLLQLSDMVKFAKATPAAELHPQSLERVRTFVRETAAVKATETVVVEAATPEVPAPAPQVVAPTIEAEVEMADPEKLKTAAATTTGGAVIIESTKPTPPPAQNEEE